MIETRPITSRQNIRAREQIFPPSSEANISMAERWIAGIAGGALIWLGLSRRSLPGALLAIGGATLVCRGITGRSLMYKTLGINTANRGRSAVASVGHGQGIKVEKSVTIDRPAAELYRFWRNFENLPRFMNHLESVRKVDDRRSHWVAKAPAGASVEWDAEVYNEKENELIAWRSLENADVNHAGSVQFREAPNGRGTEVRVVINYEPPAGKLGASIAKLFGEEPEKQLEDDLPRFKQLMEAGEIPTTSGQPSARA
jgi:uncharacterized membrane protein